MLRNLAIFLGNLLALLVVAAPALYTAGRVWVVPAVLGGLVVSLAQAGPVARSGVEPRARWPIVSGAAWFAWVAAMRVVAAFMVGEPEPRLGTWTEIAAVAGPAS